MQHIRDFIDVASTSNNLHILNAIKMNFFGSLLCPGIKMQHLHWHQWFNDKDKTRLLKAFNYFRCAKCLMNVRLRRQVLKARWTVRVMKTVSTLHSLTYSGQIPVIPTGISGISGIQWNFFVCNLPFVGGFRKE